MDAPFLLIAVVAGVIVALAVAAMAIGVIFRRPCLRGSCGGPGVAGPDGEPLSCAECPNRRRSAGQHAEARPATRSG